MKVQEDFIKAKKLKGLQSFSIFKRLNEHNYYFRLSFEKNNRYSDENGNVDISLDSKDIIITRNIFQNDASLIVQKVSFGENVYFPRNNYSGFFNAIHKNCDLKFEILVNNNSDLFRRLNLVCHQLYGIVNEKRFLLFSYVGEQNEASPVQLTRSPY